MKLKHYIKDFLNYLKFERQYSRHTILSYETDLNQANEIINLSLNLKKSISFYISFLSNQGLSNRSISRKLSSLKHFLKYLNDQSIFKNDINMSCFTISYSEKYPSTLSPKNFNEMLKACKIISGKHHMRDKLIIEILFRVGLRVSELINLKWTDFDEKFSHLIVKGKGNKSRLIPVYQSLSVVLLRYYQLFSQCSKVYLFSSNHNNPISRQCIYQIVKKYASFFSFLNISPHSFRHSFATNLIETGASIRDVQLLLGHESISTTQMYQHLSKRHLHRVYQQNHPRYNR